MKNWNIGTRLGSGFALVLALMVLIAVIGVLGLQTVGSATHEMVQRSLVKERLVADWLQGTTSNSVRTLALVRSYEPRGQADLQKEIGETSKRISEVQNKVEAMLSTAQPHVLLQAPQRAHSRTRSRVPGRLSPAKARAARAAVQLTLVGASAGHQRGT